jgi:GDPmannose 4,6-dehydratase
MPNALITGITGQDGAYLSKLLVDKGYNVWGTVRSGAARVDVTREILVRQGEACPASLWALEALGVSEEVRLIGVDYSEINSMARAIDLSAPDEVYNLAAQSSVARSFEAPTETGEITALGVARLLHALREVKPDARFYQASSSEMFGKARETPQREDTPFYPRSPYGAAKVYAHCMTVNYREAYGLHASCGILYNHESPLRPERFVTRKITQAAARIRHGQQQELVLGDLSVQRDWGFAGDYVEAMWLMLQQEEPDDYIIATGETHSLREFVEASFHCVGLDYRQYVRTDANLLRPAEVQTVTGDNSKVRQKLGWAPRLPFEELVQFLVEADVRRAQNHADVRYHLS